MSQRLYLPAALLEGAAPGQSIGLDKAQSHYLGNVLRLKAGAAISCFNGAGTEWQAEVSNLGRRASLTLGNVQRQAPAPEHALTLAVAWLKGAAMDTVMQKACELGASRIVVLSTERSNVHLDAGRLGNKLHHWQRILISAAEQSGRLHLPGLAGPTALSEVLTNHATRRILLDPGAPLLDAGTEPAAMTLAVGPEGGWSDAERGWARANDVEIAGLGDVTLRAETAPLAALAAVRHSWGWRL